MTNEARLIQWWADHYQNCAVNHVPQEVILKFPMGEVNRRTVQLYGGTYNMRFHRGEVDGVCRLTYTEEWNWPPLDAICDYDILAASACCEPELDVDAPTSLEGVL